MSKKKLKKTAKTDSEKDNLRQDPDNHKDSTKTQNPVEPLDNVENMVSEGLSEPSTHPSSQQIEKAEKIVEVAELIASGMSIREIVKELKPMNVTKSFAEKVSKGMKRSTSTKSARGQYLEKPYELALQQKQDLMSDKIKSMVNDALLLSLQIGIYKDVLGLGSQKHNSDDLFEKILLTKVASGGNSLDAKQLTDFATNLKSLLGTQPEKKEDFFQKYAQLKSLETSAITQHSQIEQKAYQKAKSDADKSMVTTLAEKGLELGKKILTRPNIPTPSNNPNAIPSPATISNVPSSIDLLPSQREAISLQGKSPIEPLESLSLPSLPNAEPIHETPPNLGYSNWEDPYHRTPVKKLGKR